MSYRKENAPSIQSLFNGIASSYDRTNTILSFGFHKYWNRTLIQSLSSQNDHPLLLDLCAGTGEIGLSFLKKNPHAQAILLDFSSEMLAVAEKKGISLKNRFETLVADAQKIPLNSSSVDVASIAYGIRNVKETSLCFQETLRVLKPGGCLGILELTRPHSSFLRFGHGAYLRFFLPLLGKWAAKNQDAYAYLSSSIQQFSSPSELKKTLLHVGFQSVQVRSLTGGIATVILAKKGPS